MNSTEWKETYLGEIAEIVMGQSPAGETCNQFGIGLPLLNGPTEFGNYSPSPVQFTTDPKKTSLIGDLLFCVRGSTTGRMNWSDQVYAIGRGIAAIRHIKGIAYQPYLKALIEYNLPFLLAEATGSTFPNVSSQQLNNLSIKIPSLPTQRRIAEILSSLDDKIELNRQTNITLEAIAQSIFKEWFIDFNFPGATGEMIESELGLIPKGWRVGKLEEVCKLYKGVSYKSSELQPSNSALVTLKSINRRGGFNINGFKEYIGGFKESQILLEGDLIFAQTDITQNAEVVGSPALVENPFGYKKLIASLDIVKCEPRNEMPSSVTLFYFLQRQEFKDYCLSHTNGSTVLHLRSSEVPNYEMTIPNISILENFDSLITPVRLKILENTKQNIILAELRDNLLPILMDGEIYV